MADEKRKDSVLGFFENESKYGVFYNSITITPEILERFAEMKEGGRLKFRILPTEKRKKVAAFLDYQSPEELEAGRAAREANKF